MRVIALFFNCKFVLLPNVLPFFVYLQNFLGEINKENTDSGKVKESSVDDVRNYVIVRTLGGVLLPFKRDLGHLMAG